MLSVKKIKNQYFIPINYFVKVIGSYENLKSLFKKFSEFQLCGVKRREPNQLMNLTKRNFLFVMKRLSYKKILEKKEVLDFLMVH